jgi:DNA repair exonuclease SbcCD ATPase subunit
MKVSPVCLFVLVVSIFVMPEKALAQSTAQNLSRPASEQSLQELVKEVRQLRATIQRINAAAYKGQVMLERLKMQQEQVSRATRELNDLRENLGDIRAQQARVKELVSRTESGVEVGTKHPGELAAVKTELDMLNLREQRLAVRETQLANELELERAKLNDLNERLNTLELDMIPK